MYFLLIPRYPWVPKGTLILRKAHVGMGLKGVCKGLVSGRETVMYILIYVHTGVYIYHIGIHMNV